MPKKFLWITITCLLVMAAGVISLRLKRQNPDSSPAASPSAAPASATTVDSQAGPRRPQGPAVKLANPETAESLIRPLTEDLLDPKVANTPGAILAVAYAAYGLSNEQRAAVESAYREFDTQIKTLRRQHVTVVKDSPEEQIYEIGDFAPAAEEIWKTFCHTLKETIGEPNAESLRKSLESRSLYDMACLGRYRHRLEFQPQSDGRIKITRLAFFTDGNAKDEMHATTNELPHDIADLFAIAQD